jgi:gluconate 5-dehydrogenase
VFELDGKTAVVIGGSGEIGRACAVAMARQGAAVVVGGRDVEKLRSAVKHIESTCASRVEAFPVDVTDEGSVEQFVDAVVSSFGTADVLVNAHGINFKRPPLEFTVSDWDLLFAVNVRGVMLACKHFGAVMVKNRSGRIVNISSVRGVLGADGGNHGYGATKAAVDTMTRNLAADWGRHGITVNAVAPFVIEDTAMGRALAPERLAKLLERNPIPRLGTPDDVAQACVYLATAEWVTGQILYVDGGLTAT